VGGLETRPSRVDERLAFAFQSNERHDERVVVVDDDDKHVAPSNVRRSLSLSLLSNEERLIDSRFEIASMQPLIAFECLLHQVRGALARRRGGAAPALL
jgi:hypothetical protein